MYHVLNLFIFINFKIIFVIEFGPINSHLWKGVGYKWCAWKATFSTFLQNTFNATIRGGQLLWNNGDNWQVLCLCIFPPCPEVSEPLGASRDNDSCLITVKCYWTSNKKYSPPQNNMIQQPAFLPITGHSGKSDLSSFSNRNVPLQNVCGQVRGFGDASKLCSRIPQFGLHWTAVFMYA